MSDSAVVVGREIRAIEITPDIMKVQTLGALRMRLLVVSPR